MARDFDVVTAARTLSEKMNAVTRARVHANWDQAYRDVSAALAECAKDPDTTIGTNNQTEKFSPKALQFVIEASTRPLDIPYKKTDLIKLVTFLDT